MALKVRIERLRAEMASDRRAFSQRVEELQSVEVAGQSEAARLALVAVALHHAYGAVEGLLSRVARFFEEDSGGGADWHRDLIHAMTLEIDGVRPAVLSTQTADPLYRLLAFRHFFRHAYAVALDGERLARLREDALELQPLLQADLDRFDEFLRALAQRS